MSMIDSVYGRAKAHRSLIYLYLGGRPITVTTRAKVFSCPPTLSRVSCIDG